jgi:PAS domain S-box-containing protein
VEEPHRGAGSPRRIRDDTRDRIGLGLHVQGYEDPFHGRSSCEPRSIDFGASDENNAPGTGVPSEAEERMQGEVTRLRARVAELERVAAERMQAESASGRQHDESRRVVEAEEALRRSEATARAFLETAGEGIIVVDRHGRIVLVNARAELMFGYRRDELIGQTLELLLPERMREIHVQHRTSYFREPRVRRMGKDLVLAGRRQDGAEFPVEISLSHVDGPDGVLAMAFVTDVTERVEMQRAARQSEKLAALGTLAAGIAHEINNPLGIISSRIEVMLLEAESEPLPRAVVDDLLTVHRHAKRVARIAQGLLSFSRQSSTEFTVVDVNRVVEDTVLLARGQIEKAGVALRVTLAPGLAPVRGNAGALGQVVLNLLTNARDASPAGGEIVIVTSSAKDDPAWVDIAVADHGHGMDAETLTRIYDPFYTTKPTGTGLGLSIAYGIVRDHGGTITAASEPGEGTRFLVRLPVAEAPPA